MTFQYFVFWVFALILVFAAVRVITVRNPVHAALHLVLVYVGAVMVLFLFVVMMLDINLAPLKEGFIRYLPVGATVAGLIVFEMMLIVGAENFGLDQVAKPTPKPAGYSNTQELGSVLYTDYVYPFEIAAVILLVAIIAAIALTLRRREGTKHQDPAKQVLVKRNDRLRIVKMEAEKGE